MSYNPGITMEEFIDIVQNDITVGCSLPKVLPNSEIQRYVERIASEYFYEMSDEATTKVYYYLAVEAFDTEEYTKYKYITLPCEIQSVSYIYKVNNRTRLQLGLTSPNVSMSTGVTNQPYLTSYVTAIGELGVYKSVLDNFNDMMNTFTLFTTKYHYTQKMNRLNILTRANRDLVLEVYARIPLQNLLEDFWFIKYVTGWAKIQQGNLMGRYDFTFAGGIKYNHNDLITQGKEEQTEVKEHFEKTTSANWFYIVKR